MCRHRLVHLGRWQDRILTAAVVVAVGWIALAPSSAAAQRSQAVFTGTVSRAPELEGFAEKVTGALAGAFASAGVDSVGPKAEKESGPRVRVEDLKRLVSDAQGRFFEADFEGSIGQIDEALKRFELKFAYADDETAWAVYSDLQILRVLALTRLGKEKEAQRAMIELCSMRPSYVPDPNQVPPNLIELHGQVLEKVNKGKRGKLSITSRPAGGKVLLDGVEVGTTPVEIDDVRRGTHYVAVSIGEERHEEKIKVGSKPAKVTAELGDPRSGPAKKLNDRIRLSHPEGTVEELSEKVSTTVLTAVIERAEGAARVTVVLGRFDRGRLVAVTGSTVADDLSDLPQVAKALVQVSRVAVGDASIDGTPNPALRQTFLGSVERDPIEGPVAGPAEDPDDNTLLYVGIGVGVVAVAVVIAIVVAGSAGGGYAYYVLAGPGKGNPGGTDIVIDASRL